MAQHANVRRVAADARGDGAQGAGELVAAEDCTGTPLEAGSANRGPTHMPSSDRARGWMKWSVAPIAGPLAGLSEPCIWVPQSGANLSLQ